MDAEGLKARLNQVGHVRLPHRLGEESLFALERLLEAPTAFSRRPVGLLPLRNWLAATFLDALMSDLLGAEARVVRAFYLDKTPGENWALAWHQDTTLAFVEPLEVEGFHAWVNKAHFFHAQAPGDLMSRILSTRIHLDTIEEAQGPLKVLPGSHAFGILGDEEIRSIAASTPTEALPAQRGEIVLMRPLLLHGSDRASDPKSRRILHLEWAAFDPPGGLRWAWF